MMKRIVIFIFFLFLTISIIGCEERKMPSVSEVINESRSLETVNKQLDYLIQEARDFYNSKEYKEALELAEYILTYLDQHSEQALDLIEKIKNHLSDITASTAEDIKKMLDSFQYPQNTNTAK
jgi:hypothetical protein